MHKVYENNDLMMYFGQRYCHCCGGVLERKRTERVVHLEDPEHFSYCTIGRGYHPHGDILVIGREYWCPFCNKAFSCDEQVSIKRTQKLYRKKIVTKEEIDNSHDQCLENAKKRMLKFRWLMLLPAIGGIICHILICNSILSEISDHKENKVFGLSVLALVGAAMVVKAIFSIFGSIELINQYETISTLFLSLFAYNLPVLCYINHRFKK